MQRLISSCCAGLLGLALAAQGYTSFFTGNTVDALVSPLGGVCMMGGASEFDPAMHWFLQRANGGDVLVLRASGADGYNDYLYSQLGGVNSVETIRFEEPSAAFHPYVAERIQKAEAIWFAGGDQWNYVSYWRDTPVMHLINSAIAQRNIAIGGTSAGMAILGGSYFSAEHGTVSSAFALSNPLSPAVAVEHAPFLDVPYMAATITDTHYDNPDRRGRHFAFLARVAQAGAGVAYGIACNEYVAVCVTPDGRAHVYGEHPQYEEYAYFLRMNCVEPAGPEVCVPGQPLTWDRNGMAVKAYKVPAVPGGEHWFDLNDHLDGQGGSWEDWSAVAGSFVAQPGAPPPCGTTAVQDTDPDGPALEWQAATGRALLAGLRPGAAIALCTVDGRMISQAIADGTGQASLTCGPQVAKGILVLRAEGNSGRRAWKLAW